MTTTSGSAKWQGGIKDGKGAISTKSGALNDYPYGFASRFEGKPGSNPEELIGAAHAACFTMALSLILGEAKLTAEQMETKADVTLEKQGDGFAITSVHLTLNAKNPGRGQGEVRGAGRQGQGRLPGVETAERQDHAGRDAAVTAGMTVKANGCAVTSSPRALRLDIGDAHHVGGAGSWCRRCCRRKRWLAPELRCGWLKLVEPGLPLRQRPWRRFRDGWFRPSRPPRPSDCRCRSRADRSSQADRAPC